MSIGRALALATERIVAPVEAMHGAISGWWFDAVGPVGAPVRMAHDTVARTVYGSIRLAGMAAGWGLDTREYPVERSAHVAAIANGLWGDTLPPHAASLETTMTIAAGTATPPTDRLVLLVHGLFQTERCWSANDDRPSLLGAFERHPDLTPLAIRYNTGRPVVENGAELADLLEATTAGWPVPVHSIALVGHSVGGLVVRSAAAVGQQAGHGWVERLSDVVTVGTPHLGAPLEKLVSAAVRALDVAPQTRPLAGFLDTRSQGIKDLRYGVPSPRVEGVAHHFVAGVVTANPAHPFGALVGDLMVRPTSGAATDLEPANVEVIGGVHHFDLLHDAGVVERILDWLDAS
jgi:pimeloyl-ACP methyl ester carboxylesterase